MYGLVFLAVKDLVLSKFSDKEWAKIVAGAKCPFEFTMDRPYDDQTLYDIVAAASKQNSEAKSKKREGEQKSEERGELRDCKRGSLATGELRGAGAHGRHAVLGMPAEEVVEHAGYWFMVYIRNKTTYGHLLEFMGDNLPDFLNNINRLHTHLLKGAHFPEIKSPRFRVSRRKKDSLVLHYSPGKETRLGLAPLVMGIVKGIAMEILKLERISVQQTKTRELDGADVFQVNWSPPFVPEDERGGRTSRGESPRAEGSGIFLQCPAAALAASGGAAGRSSSPSSSASASTSDLRRSRPHPIGLPPKGLSRLFPFHIVFDRECLVQQAGPSLQRIVGMEAGDHMSQYFTITEPPSLSFAAFRPLYLNRKVAPFTIVHDYDDDYQLTLHGEMVWCKAKQVMCFACTPVLASLEEAKYAHVDSSQDGLHRPLTAVYLGIDIADFSLCDQAQARLLTSHAQLMGTTEESTRKEKNSDRKQNIFKTSPRKKPEKIIKTPTTDKNGDGAKHSHRGANREAAAPADVPASPSSQSGKGVPRLGIGEKAEEAEHDLDEPSEEGLPVPSQSYHRMLNAFTEMLLEDSWDQYVLVRTLLRLEMSGDDSRAVRQVFEAVMNFYAQMGKVQNLLLVVIFDELNLAAPSSSSASGGSADPGAEQQAAVLFREDSVGLRMLTTFLNQEGKAYLEFLTAPLLHAASALESPIELDPARNPSAQDREQSARRVLEMAQAFLVHVCASAHRCPLSVRRVLGQVSAEVKRHWPEMHVQAVANLFFLRFLSPALVAAGVNAGGSGGGQHRVLMLVSKCVYSLMNGIPFGDKESYMASMNTFISPQNLALVQSFMRELVDEETMSRAPVSVTPRGRSAGGRLYNVVTCVGVIKQALLTSLPGLWKLASDKPPLQKKLQGLLSVALCDIPSEPY
ncbi:GTPaseactivator protein for Ras-like GTPase [Acanthamoeba castellanii str. Neff]|uniref:guanylate cyclase n=1 Tax=Acanthamoeba castellanii (strain ATCC 30010 / Neff) TaxID=1257118 RepID=L8GR76_ACACF|nr:GTPaseactivator protein for Ras-like GTPase [Acanthamoeba castellanii str. Neff]ELR14616.1 GTPaseactivator protein for Ras-like GTPase [Acanthamoeba castellanii str. Neff]